MKIEPRRENGITVRFLAQTILNDTVFPDSLGISEFVDSLNNNHNVGKDLFANLKYYFFLHLEDFGIDDKSEIDIIFWNEKVILPIEVKAFTDANSPDVKKEIIRNYFHIDALKNKSRFDFNQQQEIYPILLYSESYQKWKRGKNKDHDYFDSRFLLTKGKEQSNKLDDWGSGGYPIPEKYYQRSDFTDMVKEINRKLFFTTWEKVYQIHLKLNNANVFSKKIEEFRLLKDTFQSSNGISLINL